MNYRADSYCVSFAKGEHRVYLTNAVLPSVGNKYETVAVVHGAGTARDLVEKINKQEPCGYEDRLAEILLSWETVG